MQLVFSGNCQTRCHTPNSNQSTMTDVLFAISQPPADVTQVTLFKPQHWPFYAWTLYPRSRRSALLKSEFHNNSNNSNSNNNSLISTAPYGRGFRGVYRRRHLRCFRSSVQLDIVFQSINIMRIAYATSAWSSFVSKEQEVKIDAFLRLSYRCVFSQRLFTFRQIAEKADHTLFTSVTNPTHCLYQLLPLIRSTPHMHFRVRGHSYTLPTCTLQLYKNSFINRCLFGYIVWWSYVSFFVMRIAHLSLHFTILCMRSDN